MSSLANADQPQSMRLPQTLEQSRQIRTLEPDCFIQARVRFIAEYLENQFPLHALTVVDFDCGPGNSSGELREQLRANQVIGIDSSPDAVEIASQRYASSRFYSWTTDGVEIEPASVDVVVSTGLLQKRSAEERRVALQAISSWIRPGGVVCQQRG